MSNENNILPQKDEWDLENAERRPGVKNPRAVVSVAFPRHEFERVKEYAERHGKKVSEFIRDAALEKVEQRNQVTSIAWQGSGDGSFLVENSSGLSTQGTSTRTNDVEVEAELPEAAYT